MPHPDFAPGQRLTAAMLAGVQWQTVSQASSVIKNNNTTFIATDLLVPSVANATYEYFLIVVYSTNTTPDIKFDWTVPTSGTVSRWAWGTGTNSATTTAINSVDQFMARYATQSTAIPPGGVSSTQTSAYFETGSMFGGNGGSITLRFAQNTANASDTTFLSSSRLRYLRTD